MLNWDKLFNHRAALEWRFVRNVFLKTVFLLMVFNLGYALLDPIPLLGRVSAYNLLYPGRQRLPYGSDPERSYNLTVTQLDAMLASHEIDGVSRDEGEYRVLLIGDSSVWGFLLEPDQTVSAKINNAVYIIQDGRRVRIYNLGYPTMSVTKDLLLLERGLRYQPDLIIWFVTLESLPSWKQLDSPLIQSNSEAAQALIQRYQLRLDALDDRLVTSTFWDRTIIGQRKQLADLMRLQLYGVLWASTSIDRYIPETYNRRKEDLSADSTYGGFNQGEMTVDALSFDVLEAGIEIAGEVPVLFVNEPIFISQGENSEIRYNFYYPRWAYDEYRRMLAMKSEVAGWELLDLWDALSPTQYTDSAIHYTPEGAEQLARLLNIAILEQANQNP